ncbi:MAG: flagellar basal body protein, partial [Bradyrhizobium sp.]
MENALLIGLSRQTTLERQLDVIANNIANVNT